MKKPKLYKTPIIVARVLLFVGLMGVFNLSYLPMLIDDFNGMHGGFALASLGIFLVIAALIIFFFYGKLNAQFGNMMAGTVLLSYVLPSDIYAFFNTEETTDIRKGNIAALFIIFGFCILFGVILSLLIDPLFIIIFAAIAIFFTIVYFVTTAFRINKVQRSEAIVCLSTGGAYIFSQLHSWSTAGAHPVSVDFDDGSREGLPCPVIRVTYATLTYPAPRQNKVTLPIPPHLAEQARRAVGHMKTALKI